MEHEAAPVETEVRATDSIAGAGDWSLVLHSAAINHRLDIRDGRIVIVVGPDDEAAANIALAAYDAESVRVVEAPVPDLGPSPLGLACAVLLIALHVAAGARDESVARGATNAPAPNSRMKSRRELDMGTTFHAGCGFGGLPAATTPSKPGQEKPAA